MEETYLQSCCQKCGLDLVDEKDCLCQYASTHHGDETNHLLGDDGDADLFDLDVPMPDLLPDIDLHLECDDDSLYAFSATTPIQSGFLLPKQLPVSEGGLKFKVTFPQNVDVTPFRHHCCLCGRSLSRPSLLKDHLFRAHDIKNLHQCRFCDFKANRYALLQKHVKRKHPNYVKQFVSDANSNSNQRSSCPQDDTDDLSSSVDQPSNAKLNKDGAIDNEKPHTQTSIIALANDIPIMGEIEVESQPLCVNKNVNYLGSDTQSMVTSFDELNKGFLSQNDLSLITNSEISIKQVVSPVKNISNDIGESCVLENAARFTSETSTYIGANTSASQFPSQNTIVKSDSSVAKSSPETTAGTKQAMADFRNQCIVCGKQFSSQYLLRVHQKSHSDERPFSCSKDSCFKSFKNKSALNEHIRKVHGKRCHVCAFPTCDKAYTNLRDLKCHEASHLSLFECNWENCTKTFRDQYNLKTHYKTHTNERNFICSECNYTSIQKIALKRHLQRRHNK